MANHRNSPDCLHTTDVVGESCECCGIEISETFVETTSLWIYDLNQTNKWLLQDSTKFQDADALWAYAMRMKRHGLPIRFSYSWEEDTLTD